MTIARGPTRRRWYVVLALAGLVAALPPLYDLSTAVIEVFQRIDVDSLRSLVGGFGVWAPLASVSVMVLHGLVPFPVEVLTVTNGLLFGVWEGVAVTWGGMMLAGWLGYLVARYAGRPLALRLVPEERLAKIGSLLSGGSGWKLLAIRQIPIFSFCLLNFALGLLDVSFRRFTWTTAIGNLPYIIVLVLASDALASGL